jgi:hypothetical protein
MMMKSRETYCIQVRRWPDILREVRLVERSDRRNTGYTISADGSVGEEASLEVVALKMMRPDSDTK